jgi:hypothetical protein
MRNSYTKPVLLLLLLLVASISLSHSSAHASTLKIPFSSGEWSGGAYVDDNGKFAYCLLSANYKSGIELSITLNNKFILDFLLINEKWTLPEGESYLVKISIDGKSYGSFDAQAVRKHGILIYVGSRNDIFEHLRSGNLLTITTEKGNLSFDLTGTSKALQMLKDYAELLSHRASNDKNPYSEKNPFSSGGKSRDKDRQEIVRTILSASGLKDFKFVDPKKADLGDAEYAWESDTVFGFISTVPRKKKEDEVLKNILGNFAQECRGRFASQYEEKIYVKDYTINRAYAGCNSDDQNSFFAATVIESSSEHIVVINFSPDDSQGLKSLNDKIGMTFKNLLE